MRGGCSRLTIGLVLVLVAVLMLTVLPERGEAQAECDWTCWDGRWNSWIWYCNTSYPPQNCSRCTNSCPGGGGGPLHDDPNP